MKILGLEWDSWAFVAGMTYVAYELTGDSAIVWIIPVVILMGMVTSLRRRVEKLENRLDQLTVHDL